MPLRKLKRHLPLIGETLFNGANPEKCLTYFGEQACKRAKLALGRDIFMILIRALQPKVIMLPNCQQNLLWSAEQNSRASIED